jgi:hypothetical protein
MAGEKILQDKRPLSHGMKSRLLSYVIRLAFEIIALPGAVRPTLSVALEGAISHNNA